MGTRFNNNVFITSKRRRRRRFDVMKTLSLRHYFVMCPMGYSLSSWIRSHVESMPIKLFPLSVIIAGYIPFEKSTRLLLYSSPAVSAGHVVPWRRHQLETFNALLAIGSGNSLVTGEFPTQRPVTRSFSLICARINGWVNNCEAGDLRHHRTHYEVNVMHGNSITVISFPLSAVWVGYFPYGRKERG